MKQNTKQAWQRMKQNPFYSCISILSTAITLAFVMVAYMAYDLGSSDLPPETHRTRTVYTSEGHSWRTKDNAKVNPGMSYKTVRALSDNLPSAELVSLHTPNRPYTCEAVGGEGSKGRQRGIYVDLNWWKLFDYEFIAGRPFSEEEYLSGRKVVVITEYLARRMFQSADVAGREMLINYQPYTICGVVKDVSSQFTIVYADFWASYMAQDYIKDEGYGSENVAGNTKFIALARKGKVDAVKDEIRANRKRLNDSLLETTFEIKPESHNEHTFWTLFDIPAALTYSLLACIFLIIPAVNISGFVSSMLDKQYGEIGVRKVYGASRGAITRLFLSENLLLVLIGGFIGLLVSFLGIYLFRNWLLGVSVAYASSLQLSWWMFVRPTVFVVAFLGCLLFNLLSTIIPVWYTSGKNITDILKS